MSTDDRAAALLAGPRGRGLCAYAAQQVGGVDDGGWMRAMAYGNVAGAADVMTGLLGRVDVPALARIEHPAALIAPLSRAVVDAMYWQPPHGHDELLADPGVTTALEPVAEAVVASAAADWWFTPVDRANQREVTFVRDGDWPAVAAAAPTGLAGWLRDAAEREARSDDSLHASGLWWSTPIGAVPDTSRALQPLPAVGLLLVEEHAGDFTEALISPVEVLPDARVYEITGPADWLALVDCYPLDVSGSQRNDWYRTTGRDGAWVAPDWLAVSGDWDGVHLTVAGYLAGATRALHLDDRWATVMAGFDPDETFWLGDVVRIGEGVRWRSIRTEEHEDVWVPVG